METANINKRLLEQQQHLQKLENDHAEEHDNANQSFDLDNFNKNEMNNSQHDAKQQSKKNFRISINLFDNSKQHNSSIGSQTARQKNLAEEDFIDSHFSDLYGQRLCEKLDEWKGALNYQKRENIRQNNDGIKQIKALQENMKDIDKMQYNAKMPQLNQGILSQILDLESNNLKTEEIIDQVDSEMKQQQASSRMNSPSYAFNQNHRQSIVMRKASIDLSGQNHKIRHSQQNSQQQLQLQNKTTSLQERRNIMSHKTPIQIKLEANTRLLNQFFRQKLEQKLKTYRKKLDTLTSSNNSSFNVDEKSPTAAQLSNKKVYDILAFSSAEFKNGTLNAFKSLQKYDQNPIRLVSCNEVFKKMREEKNLQENQGIKSELQKLKKNRAYYEAIEQTLNKLFNQIEENLNSKKKILQDLRIQNYTITSKIRNYQSELKTLVQNYQRVTYELEVMLATLQRNQANANSSVSNFFSGGLSSSGGHASSERTSNTAAGVSNGDGSKMHLMRSIMTMAVTARKIKKEEVIKINQIQQQQEKLRSEFQMREQYIKNIITKLQQEIETNQKFSDNAQQELEDLKDKKNTYQHMLKEHYIQMLRQDSSALQKSMIWLIKALWKINMEVTSSIFPKFLDQESIEFLLQFAKMDQKLNDLKTRNLQERVKQQHNSDQQQLNNSEINNNQNNDQPQANMNFKAIMDNFHTVNKDDVKDMIHQMAAQNTLKVKKPVYMSSDNNRHQVQWQTEQNNAAGQVVGGNYTSRFDENNNSVSFRNMQPASPIDSDILEQHKMEQIEIKHLKQQIADLKRREFERLFKLYAFTKDEQQLKNVKKIFYALFGVQEGNQWLQELARLREISFQRLERNKTFHFKHSLQQQGFENQHRNLFLEDEEEGIIGTGGEYKDGQKEQQNVSFSKKVNNTLERITSEGNQSDIKSPKNSKGEAPTSKGQVYSNNNDLQKNKYKRHNHSQSLATLGKIKLRHNNVLQLNQEQLAQLSARSLDPLDIFMHSTVFTNAYQNKNQTAFSTPKKLAETVNQQIVQQQQSQLTKQHSKVVFKSEVQVFPSISQQQN